MIGVNFGTLCHIFTMSRSPYRESLLSGCTCHVCHRGLPFADCYAFFLIYVNSVKINFGHLACIVQCLLYLLFVCGYSLLF